MLMVHRSSLRSALKNAISVVCLLILAWPAPILAEGPNQATLIVEDGDGRVDSGCVSFSEDRISGVDLLSRSGLPVGLGQGAIGVQLCQVGDTGCDVTSQPCFCQCMTADCHYWTYFVWRDGAWSYSQVGAAQRRLVNGEADAWVWGNGKQGPSTSPAGVCQGLVAGPTATQVPVPVPTQLPTAVPETTLPETSTATAAPAPQPSATLVGLPQAPTQQPNNTATSAASAVATSGPTTSVPPAAPSATAPLAPIVTASAALTATPSVPAGSAVATARSATAAATVTASPTKGPGSYLGWIALAAVALGLAGLALARRR
jgi:hypothetical protein